MARVFIPQEPLARDPATGAFGRMMDFKPAAQFGELIFIFPPGRAPLDPNASLPVLREKLADFGPDDFLLPVGSPILIAWAAVVATAAYDGPFRMLLWDGHQRRYIPVVADNL